MLYILQYKIPLKSSPEEQRVKWALRDDGRSDAEKNLKRRIAGVKFKRSKESSIMQLFEDGQSILPADRGRESRAGINFKLESVVDKAKQVYGGTWYIR
jgi:hypothetical protein